MDTVLIDGIQTAGPGNVNFPSDRVYELGNFKSVATVFDRSPQEQNGSTWRLAGLPKVPTYIGR